MRPDKSGTPSTAKRTTGSITSGPRNMIDAAITRLRTHADIATAHTLRKNTYVTILHVGPSASLRDSPGRPPKMTAISQEDCEGHAQPDRIEDSLQIQL